MDKRKSSAYAIIWILIVFTWISGINPGWAKPDKKPNLEPVQEVIAEFESLKSYIQDLPNAQMRQGEKQSFIVKLDASQNAYIRGNPCTAADILNAYLNYAQAKMKTGTMPYAEVLRNRGQMLLTQLILNLPEGSRCRGFEDVGQKPKTNIITSDNQVFSASLSFGRPVLSTADAGGEIWTQLHIPELQSLIGEPGRPSVPMWHALVAVPMGASVKVLSNVPQIKDEFQANIYPFQPMTSDAIDFKYTDQPFEKDEAFYQTDAFYPEDPCSVKMIDNYRGLNIAQLRCSSGQYNPATQTYRSFGDVNVEVVFEGGEGDFVTSRYTSPFEEVNESAIATVINGDIVKDYIMPEDISGLLSNGEELLILTHPDFREAADDLAQWKSDKGIITNVFEVGSGTIFNTGERIDDLIEYRYDHNVIRPSYILLIGDVEFVPTARTDHDTSEACGTCGDVTTGSDYGYALYPHFLFDIIPDFAVGRISVDTLPEALRVVDKIINYESNPPFIDSASGAPFYTTAANSAEFQGYLMAANGSPWGGLDGRAQRTFTETSELVRDEMMANGYTVERIYEATEDTGGYCIDNNNPCTRQQPYTGVAMPDRYYDGTLLPADLRNGSGFAWDGDTDDIIDAFNEGRFLVLHRDHGAVNGWGTPSFRTWDFPDLENEELLPVVYSVNCSSGFFDHETDNGSATESFMEQLLLLEDAGMVSGLGDNRNSPTWANSALTRGFYDATWPNVAPEFGNSTSIVRLGDILNHGKMYLLTQVGVDQTAKEVTFQAALGELIIWHVYGDPTLEMWTRNPYRMSLTIDHSSRLKEEEEVLEVDYSIDNAVITAYQKVGEETLPIGRATVENQIATISFFKPPVPNVPIMLSASMENAVSVLLTPQASLPDLVINQLTTSTDLYLSPGESLSDKLTIVVENLGSVDAPGTINYDGTAQTGYMIDLVLSSDTSVPEGWSSAPLPEGVAFAEDGLLQSGRISRTPNIPAGSAVELTADPPVSSDIGGFIPTETSLGNYNLCARIDPGNEVQETNEDNNVFCVPVTIEVSETYDVSISPGDGTLVDLCPYYTTFTANVTGGTAPYIYSWTVVKTDGYGFEINGPQETQTLEVCAWDSMLKGTIEVIVTDSKGQEATDLIDIGW